MDRILSSVRPVLRTTPYPLAALIAALALILPMSALDPFTPAAHAGPNDGREVATRSHIDSPQTMWNAEKNTFELGTKIGSRPVKAADTVNWVGKGWGERNHRSQYQFTIPNKPGLEFLSEPGTTWYQAPAVPEDNHLPTWIGFGADTNFPVDRFRDARFSMDVVDVDGPGRFELFNSFNDGDHFTVNRLLSSSENGLRSALLVAGAHTHNTTVFSRPGTYEITYRSVARDKNTGEIIASEDTVFHWQVGGREPNKNGTKQTAAERYAKAPEGAISGTYTFSAEPKTGGTRDGDDKLTTFTFNAGDASATGTATILINGYHLTDLPVSEGKAVWDEAIGIAGSDFQIVYTPADGKAGKWISPKLNYAPGQKRTEVTSAEGSAQIMEKVNDPSNTRLDTSDIKLKDPGYDFTVKSNGDGTYTARIEMHDKHFRGYVSGGMWDSLEDPYFNDLFEGNFVNGVWEQTGDESIILEGGDPEAGYFPKFTIIPHPQVLAEGKTFTVEKRFHPDTPLTASGELTLTHDGAEKPTPDPGETPKENVCTDGSLLLDKGHVDLAISRTDEGLGLSLFDDTGIGEPTGDERPERSLDTIVFGVKNIAAKKRTEHQSAPIFDVLGPVGSTYFELPSTQNPELIWPGYNTQSLDYSTFDGPVTLHLDSVVAPKGAHMALLENKPGLTAEPVLRWDSREGGARSFDITFATHAHPTWVFSSTGTYELTVRASAKTSDGKTIESKPEVLRIAVGSEAMKSCGTPAEKPGEEQPTEPSEPSDPSEPDQPGDDEKPADPTEPGTPGDDQPGTPGEGDKPGQPGQPGGHADLAQTGADLTMLGWALPLVSIGAVLVLVARQRQQH